MASLTREQGWSAEDGAALIEFAIVLPLMLLVLLGTMDFGMLFQRYQVVTNAAREGARIAVLPGYSSTDVEQRVKQFLTAGGLTEVPLNIAVVSRPENLEGTGKCMNIVSVTVDYPYQYSAVGTLASFFGGTAFTRTGLQARSAMRSELASGMCS